MGRGKLAAVASSQVLTGPVGTGSQCWAAGLGQLAWDNCMGRAGLGWGTGTRPVAFLLSCGGEDRAAGQRER